MCGQYSILCLVFNRLNVLYLSSCNVCDFFDQLWCFTLFLTKVVYLLLRSWEGKTISNTTRGEFLRPLNANFASELLADILGFVYVLRWNCAKTSPGGLLKKRTLIWEGVCGRRLFDMFVALFLRRAIYFNCREKSVQCLINRIYKFVTTHNFSVERHFCMLTPILFSHRKYF